MVELQQPRATARCRHPSSIVKAKGLPVSSGQTLDVDAPMSREENITSEYPTVQIATVGPLLLTLCHSVRTDVGLVRDHNEDDFIALPEHGLYLVADGMGGHNAGAVASQICVDTTA